MNEALEVVAFSDGFNELREIRAVGLVEHPGRRPKGSSPFALRTEIHENTGFLQIEDLEDQSVLFANVRLVIQIAVGGEKERRRLHRAAPDAEAIGAD